MAAEIAVSGGAHGGPMGGAPGTGTMMPPGKARDSRGTLLRLLRVLRPERVLLCWLPSSPS